MPGDFRCEYADRHPAIDREMEEHDRRLNELERLLRPDGSIFEQLASLARQLTDLKASMRTAAAIGTLVGSAVGGGIALAVDLIVRAHP